MTEKAVPNIGHLTDGKHGRDAIHIAVCPMIATERLGPGQKVGLVSATEAGPTDDPVGIVDPFLETAVEKGQTFWLFLFPNTITSLKHQWTHPAFEVIKTMEAISGEGRSASEAWLRNYAKEVNSYLSDDNAYQTLLNDLRSGEITYHGTDMHGRSDLQEEENLRHHASIVLGIPINFDNFTGFYCTC